MTFETAKRASEILIELDVLNSTLNDMENAKSIQGTINTETGDLDFIWEKGKSTEKYFDYIESGLCSEIDSLEYELKNL